MQYASEANLWIICPVCHQPNPQGYQFCRYCWGTLAKVDKLISYEEALEISKQRLSRLKRQKLTRTIATNLIYLLISASVVCSGLFFFTDILYKPPQVLNSSSPPGEWTMFRHDLGHSGTAGESGALPQGILKWSFATGGAIHSSPAVAYGTVYFGSRDSKLYAVDAATGTKRWEFETGSWVESSPAIANGVVYFGSNDSRLYALDAHSGEKLWEFETDYPIMSPPAIADGIVYFGADDYHLYALDATKGKKLWDFDAKGLVKSSPVVANGIVYFGSGTDFFYALDALSGRFRLRFKTIYMVASSPAVVNETIYLNTINGHIYAIDGYARNWPREHEIKPFWIQLWIMGLPGVPPPPVQSGLLWLYRTGEETYSSPSVADNTLYIGSGNKLFAIDTEHRQQLWDFETGARIRSSPSRVNTTIYVGSEDSRLYALDATTGEKLWHFATGDKITSSPAVVDGTVYITSHDGSLYAIK